MHSRFKGEEWELKIQDSINTRLVFAGEVDASISRPGVRRPGRATPLRTEPITHIHTLILLRRKSHPSRDSSQVERG